VVTEVESFHVTINRLHRAGQPAGGGVVFLLNQDTGRVARIFSPEPSVTQRVAKGSYALIAWFPGGNPEVPEISMVIDPTVVIDRAVTLTADARAAKPVAMTVPRPDAVGVASLVDTAFVKAAEWSAGFGLLGGDFTGVFVGQPDPAERLDMMTSAFSLQLVKGPLPDEGPLPPSPYAYFLGHAVQDHLPTGFTRRFADRDLATVHTAFATQGVPNGETAAFAQMGTGFAVAAGLPVTLPSTRTDHFAVQSGLTWGRDLLEGNFDTPYNWQTAPPATFQAGRTYHERQNLAVFGPGWSPFVDVGRFQNQIGVFPLLFSAPGGWYGHDASATGRTVVERDGQVILDEPVIGTVVPSVPVEDSAYKIRVEAKRTTPNSLSTGVTAEWTFRSATVPGEEARPFPLSAVRFAPPVNQQNTAPAGRVWLVPVEVQRAPNSAAGRARTLTVEVSYDDGATWRHVPVLRFGQQGLALLHHPAGAGFVSLRAGSADAAGNTVTQTVIRAYAIG
jgi:hypothetical protein